MKKGVPTSDGFILPYVYHGDAIRTFRYGNNRLAIEISYLFSYLLGNYLKAAKANWKPPFVYVSAVYLYFYHTPLLIARLYTHTTVTKPPVPLFSTRTGG